MDFEWNKEQELLRDSILKTAENLDSSAPFEQRWKAMAETGMIGTCVSSEYGGSGLSAIDMLLVLEALAEGQTDNGLSFALAAHTLSCVMPIDLFASPEQKVKYLPGLMDGSLIAANAMTEAESGSDVFQMRSRAEATNEGYRLNGSKIFISNAKPSSLVLTYAVSDPDKGFFGGLSAFLVESTAYRVGAEFEKMGLESCSLGEIIFEDVDLGKDALMGKVGGGGVIFNHSMEWERICLTGVHLGAMRRILKKTLQFVRARKSQGKSIGKFQAVGHTLAEMKASLEVARQYAYKAAWMLSHKKNIGEEAAIAKLVVSQTVQTFMLKALQVHGGYGYVVDYGIEQEVRDALASTIYSGTSEIQKNIIATYLRV